MSKILIETVRLKISLMSEEHQAWYVQHVRQDGIMKYITGRGLNEEEAAARFQRAINIGTEHHGFGFLVVQLKDDDRFVGIGKLSFDGRDSAELGYSLELPFWGRGFAKEIMLALEDYARRNERVKKLTAIVDPDNFRSLYLLEKAGFQIDEIGIFKDSPSVFLSKTLI